MSSWRIENLQNATNAETMFESVFLKKIYCYSTKRKKNCKSLFSKIYDDNNDDDDITWLLMILLFLICPIFYIWIFFSFTIFCVCVCLYFIRTLNTLKMWNLDTHTHNLHIFSVYWRCNRFFFMCLIHIFFFFFGTITICLNGHYRH